MKELSIEEKAKRYDEAIEKGKQIQNTPYTAHWDTMKEVAEHLLPELKESEDEKIRKEIISFVQQAIDTGYGIIDKERKDKWIAWLEKQGEPVEINPSEFDTRLQALIGKFGSLPKEELIGILSFWMNVVQNDGTYKNEEKQGEQKPADKIEPKFKVEKDKWYVCTSQYCNCIEGRNYKASLDGRIIDDYGTEYDMHSDAYRWFRPWTIQDAKDGDVLYDGNAACIFRKTMEDDDAIWIDTYCGINIDNEFKVNDEDECWCLSEDCSPATKEQRDTLMKAMTETGYTFDFEKKELKKIEQKPAEWSIFDYRTWQYIVSDVLTKKDGIGQYLDNGECKKIAKYMQEEWSKRLSVEQRTTELPKGEDYGIDGLYAAIDILQKTLGKVDGYQSDDGILTHKCAISSVKELFKQNPTWSEEDEKMWNDIISIVKGSVHPRFYDKVVSWLKSLEYRVQPKQEWSEDDEDMCYKAIAVINRLCAEGKDYVWSIKTLKKLFDWLKSLRPQSHWKLSDEHYELEEFAKIVRGNLTGISEAVQKQFEAKYLQLTGNKMYGGFKD